jgi:hypothetical protein
MASVSKKSSVKATTPAATNALVAAQPEMAYNANSMAYLANNMFLPNPDFGDRDKPYHTSEYRRKSW